MANQKRKHLVVLTGAGMSAESGIPTFRGVGGLWRGHQVTEVASPQGWNRDPSVVLEFYNERRKKALESSPNRGHEILAELENVFDVSIVTQNVDDLHERAGSNNVLHLHGEIFKARSTTNANLVYPIDGWQLNLGDVCELGSQLRPHIVWFGESVPMIEVAAKRCQSADVFVVVGTSLVVYPAAGLIDFVSDETPKFIIDPEIPDVSHYRNIQPIAAKASTGLEQLRDLLVTEQAE